MTQVRGCLVLTLVFLSVVLGACASSRMSDKKIDRLFREGRYEECVKRLEEGLKDEGDGKDQLLFLFDLGLAHHMAGNYKESNKYFLAADRVSEIKDYTSLSTEAATLLTSDNIKQYKGEDFERVMISVYLAINFALLGEHEDALVEARRVNRKLYLMVSEGERKYKQNAFARYLSAVLYEDRHELDSAYIDYKKAFALEPEFPGLQRDLWRLALDLDRIEDQRRWKKEFQWNDAQARAATEAARETKKGEIIVVYQNGISPIKIPHPNFHSVPKFKPRYNPVSHAVVEINGKKRGETAILHDVEATAILNLEEKWGGILAKKIAGVVAKEVVGKQVENATDSKFLGFLTKIFLHASDQADVRSWRLLPKDLQIARFVLDPGEYKVRLDPVGDDPLEEKTVRVAKGRKTLINFRYIP